MTLISSFKDCDIVWLKSASKQFDRLPHIEQKKILKKLDTLLGHAERLDIKKLKSFEGLYRIRSGDYRVIFKVAKGKKLIIVSAVGHRKEVYNLLTTITRMLKSFEIQAQA